MPATAARADIKGRPGWRAELSSRLSLSCLNRWIGVTAFDDRNNARQFLLARDGLDPQHKRQWSFLPPPCLDGLIFTLFCSRHWLRSLSSSRRAPDAHCDASLRMRLFMKLSDSFPVPTCSSRPPMSDRKTACRTHKQTTNRSVLRPRLDLMNKFDFFFFYSA